MVKRLISGVPCRHLVRDWGSVDEEDGGYLVPCAVKVEDDCDGENSGSGTAANWTSGVSPKRARADPGGNQREVRTTAAIVYKLVAGILCQSNQYPGSVLDPPFLPVYLVTMIPGVACALLSHRRIIVRI